ncbi:MAG: uroporphyrinogen-III synthase [Schleiferiaceae bacterium]|nr:uroporphyrinogen-III synthase [Schleiferiaceae bacterium]MDR9441638.1 uroporphyrinogen-III synthase [Schleiferiaceae bacterium]
MPHKPLILATRSLPTAQQDRLEQAGFAYQEKDFIEVQHRFDEEAFAQALQNEETQARVITSKNTVYSLQRLLEVKPGLHWPAKKTFTVGIKATEMLAELGLKADARAENAISLAQIIARNPDVNAVDFFCGSQALDDLPEYLKSKNIKVNQHIVYHTEWTTSPVETEPLDGIIFLSPSAVFSFFKTNRLPPETPCFCIGATTAEAVHLRCDNPRLPAEEPSLEGVVDRVIQHFGQTQPSS